ncbi:1-aminocyclopropane-1-carboxylate oxidase [Aspergillus luchuensis]|uniref:1-aminocyclopropane-1-carboxylate oxidase n=1 Tax=Aspergillus kawachii TaxID=1069201 RepID=A0A146FF57_ASPKA|nr:1-aminocyclopropane-1-carboxylate oxidase [Aspergillus luchuensis]
MDKQAFQEEPPFPEGLNLAQLEVIDYDKLVNGPDADEAGRLFEACKHYGFFYLKLDHSEKGQQLLDLVKETFTLQKKVFDLPVEEKRPYDTGQFLGYTAPGGTVIDRNGTRDRMEVWNLGKDDIMQPGYSVPKPPLLLDSQKTLQNFTQSCHEVALTILAALESLLDLPKGTFADLHRLSAESGDHVRFLKVPPQPDTDRRTALGEHTDFGSITVLFNRLSGLRVVEPGRQYGENDWDEWPWVQPRPGNAIINLGDALVKFTNGLFRSNVHRVDPPLGTQKLVDRYSLIYFSRPRDDVVLKRLPGSGVIPPLADGVVEEELTSKEWIERRAAGKRHGKFKGPEHWDRMSGTESASKAKASPLVVV